MKKQKLIARAAVAVLFVVYLICLYHLNKQCEAALGVNSSYCVD